MTTTSSTNAQGNPSPAPTGQGEPLEPIVQTLKAMLPELRDTYGVVSLGVFGSYVRGEQTPDSDLDLLVEFDPAVQFGLLTYCELENALSDRGLNKIGNSVFGRGARPCARTRKYRSYLIPIPKRSPANQS